MAVFTQTYVVMGGVGLHVGWDGALVGCAQVTEDASTHAAVVFAVPKGEGGLARVTCVHMQIVHPGVWQSWSYIHILEAVWEVILFSCRIPRFAKSLVDKVMGEPRPNPDVFWRAHVF